MVTAAEVKAVSAQVQKIGAESSATLDKVRQLEEALANAGGIPQDVQDAFEELKAQVKVVDDLVADAAPTDPTTPTDPAPVDPNAPQNP